MLVLLVEDNLDLAELVAEYLESEAIECDLAYNGVMGLELVKKNHYDVIIMDLMMPRMNGLTLCYNIRKLGIATPCLMLTARDTLEDKISGFEHGTDDYMVKPFELKELVLRLKALSRRYSNPADLLQVEDLLLNTVTRQAQRNQQSLKLSPNEWKMLECLMRQSPKVVSRAHLKSLIWDDEISSKDALKTLIYRLRQIIDGTNQQPLIHTIRGAGVVLRREHENND
jgi:DNA-binding response OmpR family regulator